MDWILGIPNYSPTSTTSLESTKNKRWQKLGIIHCWMGFTQKKKTVGWTKRKTTMILCRRAHWLFWCSSFLSGSSFSHHPEQVNHCRKTKNWRSRTEKKWRLGVRSQGKPLSTVNDSDFHRDWRWQYSHRGYWRTKRSSGRWSRPAVPAPRLECRSPFLTCRWRTKRWKVQ